MVSKTMKKININNIDKNANSIKKIIVIIQPTSILFF